VTVRGPFPDQGRDKRSWTVTVRRGALVDRNRFYERKDADALVERLVAEGATHINPNP
jgi:hypothetical protein